MFMSVLEFSCRVETRIRTYEGADSHTKIATLQQHFPTFKKGMIDRCFTKNLLDFDKAYTELFILQKSEQEARSKIKLILTPKGLQITFLVNNVIALFFLFQTPRHVMRDYLRVALQLVNLL